MDWAAGGASGAADGGVTGPSAAAGVVGALPTTPGGLSRSLAGAAAAGAQQSGTTLSEVEASRSRVLEFLQRHTAYELLPESSKVVVLDTGLPVRQAFHALYEQNVHTAPLWDPHARAFVGMISPGDFIALLCQLQSLQAGVSGAAGGAGAPPQTLSELDLDWLTIDAWMRDTAAEGGPQPHVPWSAAAAAAAAGGSLAPQALPQLVSVSPEDSLHSVAHALLRSGSGALPMLSSLASGTTAGASGAHGGEAAGRPAPVPSSGSGVPQLLHLCTLSGVLACLMRHFRGVPNALPLLSQPLGSLPIGTWVDSCAPRGSQSDSRASPSGGVPHRPLVTMHPSTPLKTALAMLLQAGVGALPIVDDNSCLLDVYARNDILALARNNAYSQLPLDSISVSQALHFMKAGAAAAAAAAAAQGGASGAGGAGGAFAAPAETGNNGASGGRRCYTCTRADTLRTAMETLALPGVMRLVCVQPGTQRIEGIITLTDVASFLFL